MVLPQTNEGEGERGEQRLAFPASEGQHKRHLPMLDSNPGLRVCVRI